MYQTMTEIGKQYGIDAKTVGRILYDLKLRDRHHPEQKGFPFEQVVTHGIAKAYTGRSGDIYYKYDIERIRDEFEALAAESAVPRETQKQAERAEAAGIAEKLQQMLTLLNEVLSSGEIGKLYRLKADIADIYALLPTEQN